MKRTHAEKGKKVLASLVMGINAVNVFAPMVQSVDKMADYEGQVLNNAPKEIALDKKISDETAGYDTLDTVAGYVNNLVFQKAYAWTSNVTSGNVSVGTMVSGDVMNITNATGAVGTMIGGSQNASNFGTGIVDIMNSGYQFIQSSGVGTVVTMNSGEQWVRSSAVATVVAMSGGVQKVQEAGVGTVVTMNSGIQLVYSGGAVGTVVTMNSGEQYVYSGGVGTVETMNSGIQRVSNATGTVVTMNGGWQGVSNGGVGTVVTMNGGRQDVFSGGTGTVETMNSGFQGVSNGGVGTVVTMNNGGQWVLGTGTVVTMSGGSQWVSSGGVGTVVTMNDGYQEVWNGGVVTVETMNSGLQTVYEDGVGTVVTMNSGEQYVQMGGTGTVETMNSGVQNVYSGGVGTVVTMNDGYQDVDSGGVGTVVTMEDGWQFVSNGGVGTVVTMNDGEQIVDSGGVGTIVTMNNGQQDVSSGGTGTVATMNDGVQFVDSGGTGTVVTMNDGVQRVDEGGSANIVNFLGGTQLIFVDATVSGQVINGGTQLMVLGGALSEATVLNSGMLYYGDPGSEVKDFTMNGGKTVFATVDGTKYKFTGFFKANGGVVDMTEDPYGTFAETYETLTIEHLSGVGGTFKINTDLASETNSDKIDIITSDPGTKQYIQVVDSSLASGSTVIGMRSLLIAKDDSGNSIFEGKALDTGGLWELTPVIESDDGVNWYLRTIEKKENPSTEALTANISSTYALWRSALTDDNLRLRLGDLRLNEDKIGVWARVKANSMSGNDYDAKSQVFQVGYDKAVGKNVFGVAVDQTNTSSDLTNGKSDGSMTGISLYMTNYKDNGMYSDIVLRGGKLRNDMDSYGEYPDKLDIDTFGYSASYEIGKTIEQGNGWFIEPQGQLVYGHLNGGEYTTNRGVVVDRNGVNSLIARLGFVVGQRNETSDYYLKANFYREFLGKDKMDLRAANGETMDYASENKGNWFELGLGGNVKLAKETYFYGDVSKTFGGDIKKKWQVNAGVRFTW